MSLPLNVPLTLSLNFKLTKPGFQLAIQHEIQWDSPSVHVVFGESGCGKSHLLRSICGLENTGGKIQFNGHDWQNDDSGLLVPTHKRQVSMVFQDGQLFEHLNVLQNLMFAYKRSHANQSELDLCIHQLNIKDLLNYKVSELSGGEKQRVAIARSLLSKPQLLLMDEPLASLDWKSKSEILPFIQRLSKDWNLPILYVTHSIDEVMELANHVILIEKSNGISQIKKSGPLLDILSDINNPFNQQANASSLLIGSVKQEGYQNDGLHKIQLAEQFLYLTNVYENHQQGQPVRLNIKASDVSISLSHAMDSSILNILNGTITDIKAETSGHCLVQFRVDNQTLISRISMYSTKRLNLKVGMSVFAQIKAVALSK